MQSVAGFLETYPEISVKKANSPAWRLLLLGVLAGFWIGLGGAVSSGASFAVENAGLARLINGALFPVGLILVVFTGSELFTGNCLMTIGLLERRVSLRGMAKNLVLVYAGNFLGAAVMAAACVFCGPVSGEAMALSAISRAVSKCSLPFGNALALGVLCNILVCAAVMMATMAHDAPGKILACFVPVCAFVICGFEHCVANMFYVPEGLFLLSRYGEAARASGIDTSALRFGAFLLRNLLPVTLGNILGGVAFSCIIWICHKQ